MGKTGPNECDAWISVTVTLTCDQCDRLDDFAAFWNISRSEAVRWLIDYAPPLIRAPGTSGGGDMSETQGEYRFSPADADDIANSMAYVGDSPRYVRTLKTMVKRLTTQLQEERAERQEAECELRDEIEALREELAHQRRLTARLMPGQEDIETVCAWCGTHMSGPTGAAQQRVSHGICDMCLKSISPDGDDMEVM